MKSLKNKKKPQRKTNPAVVAKAKLFLALYIRFLKEYFKWSDKTKRSYGWKPGREFDSINLKKVHYNKLVEWNNLLRALEKHLGLTPKQIKEIEQKIDNGEW